MRLTPQDVYDRLVGEDKILEIRGQIRFFLGEVSIVVHQRDVVGNIIQEWLRGWLDYHGVEYVLNDNSQMPPDFYLNSGNCTTDLLEVKAFNRSATPAFDIADFNSYQREICERPYMLHAKYLIFGYEMTHDGYVVIKDLWLKDVWSICRCMDKWALNLQIKDRVVHKIRPAVWYGAGNVQFPPFESLEDFISAIEQTVYQNPKTRDLAGTWLADFIVAYEHLYARRLKIPRWSDIADRYRKQRGNKT